MVYTEIKEKNGREYYYRVINSRKGNKFKKSRVYLGVNLTKEKLKIAESKADKKLLSKKQTSIEIDKIKSKILPILKENNVVQAGIFGSYARGEQREDSDIDLIVDIKDKKMSLIGFIELIGLLEEVLNKKVDLVEYSAIKHLIKESILQEEVRIL